jgi:Recombination enhancement, RecA-dependent nuclease
MKRTGILRASSFDRTRAKPMKRTVTPMKSKGMKGATPTALDKQLWDDMAKLGCIACLKDGQFNPTVSIHHIDGRTKSNAHSKVLPLCAQHHQHDDTDPLKRVGVHPYKTRFESLYGSQSELLSECMWLLGKVER